MNSRAIVGTSLGVSDVREEGMERRVLGSQLGYRHGPCGVPPPGEINVYCKTGAGQDVEVWNVVFNANSLCSGSLYEGSFWRARHQELDLPLRDQGHRHHTGMAGLERLVMCVQKTKDIFETDLFAPLLALLPTDMPVREKRIVADHARATAFLVSDGVRPSNKGAGYVLRRLMRRAIVIAGEENRDLLAEAVHMFAAVYPNLDAEEIGAVWSEENEKFQKTLSSSGWG